EIGLDAVHPGVHSDERQDQEEDKRKAVAVPALSRSEPKPREYEFNQNEQPEVAVEGPDDEVVGHASTVASALPFATKKRQSIGDDDVASSATSMNDTAVASKTPRIVLAVGGLAYLVGVFVASANPGPRAWALHSLGFTPSLVRIGGLAVLAAGVALLLVGALGGTAAPEHSPTTPHRGPTKKHAKGKRAKRQFFLPLLLVPLAAIFAHLRARTQFLGDGSVWLSGLQANMVTAKNEPLSATLWLGVTSLLRSLHVPIEANTLAVFSILCGLAAATFAWGIARELAPQKPATAIVFALLLTLATTELFCGYIESYPPVAMFVFGFLWLGLRRVRGAGPTLLFPVAFVLCVTGHLATGVLAPAYLFLALRGPESKAHRIALAAAGPALAIALLLLLGSNSAEWLRSFATAIRGGDVANL